MPPLKENLSLVLHGINNLKLENRPVLEPEEYEVLLEMCCVGICGSDVHYWKEGRIGNYVLNGPMVMGHEASGIVHKVGSKVTHLKPGDRVAIEPGVPCRRCTYCRTGKYNLCQEVVFCATPPHHGNIARYYIHDADYCYKLPDHVSLEEGALLEPLSVGVHACKKSAVTVGTSVLILGCGPIGLVTLLAAKAMGASRIVITDVIQSRLDTAKELGAYGTLLVKPSDTENELLKSVHDMFEGWPDVSIDCTGFESTVRLGLEATKHGGIFTVVGMGSSEVKIPLIRNLAKEVDIRGVFRYANDYPVALEMVASGKVDVKRLITHNYKLEDSVKAFETASTGAGNAIKVMIHCRPKEFE